MEFIKCLKKKIIVFIQKKMIEILNIFYLFVTFFIIFSFPLNNIFLKKNLEKYNFNIFEIYSFNILFLLTCFLLLSFFKLNVVYIFFIFLGFALINLFFLDWLEYKKKNCITNSFSYFFTKLFIRSFYISIFRMGCCS